MKAQKSGCTKEKRAYYLFDAMQFCVPYIKALKSDNLQRTSQLKEEESPAEGDESIYHSDDDYQPISPSYISTPTPTKAAGFAQHQEPQSEPTTHNMPKKKRVNIDVDQAVIELDRKKTALSENDALASDARMESLKMFLLSMLPDLMKMDDREVRQFKRKALDAVDDILSAKPAGRPSSCPSMSNSTFPNESSPPTDGIGDYTTPETANASYSAATCCSTDFKLTQHRTE